MPGGGKSSRWIHRCTSRSSSSESGSGTRFPPPVRAKALTNPAGGTGSWSPPSPSRRPSINQSGSGDAPPRPRPSSRGGRASAPCTHPDPGSRYQASLLLLLSFTNNQQRTTSSTSNTNTTNPVKQSPLITDYQVLLPAVAITSRAEQSSDSEADDSLGMVFTK